MTIANFLLLDDEAESLNTRKTGIFPIKILRYLCHAFWLAENVHVTLIHPIRILKF